MGGRWKLVPHLLLRRAGFPFSLVEDLGCPRSAALAAQVAERNVRAEEARRHLLRAAFPAEVRRCAAAGDRPSLRALTGWRRRVGRRRTRGPGTRAARGARS